jgi:hypothetical protein
MWQYVTYLYQTFQGVNAPAGTEISLKLPNFYKDMTYAFYNTTGISKVSISGNPPGKTTMTYTFRDSDIEEIDLSDFTTESGYIAPGNFKGTFQNCKVLRIIKGVFDLTDASNVTDTQPFLNCSALEELRVKPETIKLPFNFSNCKSLSDESVQSIVEGLANLTG